VVPQGNLNATLVFKPEASPAEAAKRSFLAANALFQTLAIYVPAQKLSLKWPNDVLLSGGKVAGILLESSGRGVSVDWLSIGIGVNLKHIPQGVIDAHFPPTCLMAAGGWEVEAEDFLAILADAYATQEDHLRQSGFGRIRDDWLAQAAKLGEVISARTSREEITGTFEQLTFFSKGDGPCFWPSIAATPIPFFRSGMATLLSQPGGPAPNGSAQRTNITFGYLH